MTDHRLLIAATAAAVMLLATSAHAQRADRPRDDRVAQARDNKADLDDKRDKVRQRIRALRAWKLTEALDLDEDTAAKLFPIINGFDEKIEKVMKRHRKLKKKLKKALEDGDSAALDKLIDQAVKQQRSLWNLQEKRFEAVRKVLTSEQAAKIFVVLPQIDRKIQKEIRRAARKAKKN